jgi:hypothetical protein
MSANSTVTSGYASAIGPLTSEQAPRDGGREHVPQEPVGSVSLGPDRVRLAGDDDVLIEDAAARLLEQAERDERPGDRRTEDERVNLEAATPVDQRPRQRTRR